MYTTEAIVCGHRGRGEHDLTVRLYTKHAGMIFARAGAGRGAESKFRYGLQDFSYSTVSLVHGRYEWRVTGVLPIQNFYYLTPGRLERASLKTGVRLLRRLLPEGVADPVLFDSVLEGLRLLSELPGGGAEHAFALRVLHHLGYVESEGMIRALLEAPTLEGAHQSYLASTTCQKQVEKAIEKALSASHL